MASSCVTMNLLVVKEGQPFLFFFFRNCVALATRSALPLIRASASLKIGTQEREYLRRKFNDMLFTKFFFEKNPPLPPLFMLSICK